MNMTSISVVAACAALSGCANFFKPPATDAPLATVVEHIRSELIKAQSGSTATSLPLTEVTVTLKVTTSQKYTSGGGVDLTFNPIKDLKFTTETSGSLENTVQLKWSGSDKTNTLGVAPKDR